MRQTLQIIKGSNAGEEYSLVGNDEILLGRDSTCHVVVKDYAASRQHARLLREGNGYVIEDLASTNHTYVNGTQISGKVRLKDQDQVKIGETLLVFRSHLPEVVEQQDRFSTVLQSINVGSVGESAVEVNAEAKLRAMLRITEALGRTLDLEAVLSKMLDGLFEIFPHADRGLVLLLDGERLIPMATKQRRQQPDSIRYSRTIVRQAMVHRQAILSEDAVGDERFSHAQSLVDSQIRSVMCVPLVSQDGNPLGTIQLDTLGRRARFDTDDMHILASVANQASISVEYAQLHKDMLKQARLQKELDIAQHVQQSFLPQNPPDLEGYRFWAYYRAAGKVGGDFYDFLRLPDGTQVSLLADVAGKGLPAALMMAKASTVCKVALLNHPGNIADAVNAINNEVCDASGDFTFVTLVLCVINPQTHEITVANAGHLSPLFCRADGTVEEPAIEGVRGYPLGVARDFQYKTSKATLNPGEAAVLFSDGVSDATNSEGKLYSAERIARQLTGVIGKGPEEIGQALLKDVDEHVAGCEQNDDITLVAFQRAPG